VAATVIIIWRTPFAVGFLVGAYLMNCLLLMMRRRAHLHTLANYRHALEEWERMIQTAAGMTEDFKAAHAVMCPKCRLALATHVVSTVAHTN
jgi:hypothetical protein